MSILFFTIEYIVGLVLIGIFAGFASGLLGVGGGFIIVPLQLFLFEYIGVESNVAMLVSLATSLAIIIPTSLSGAYRHTKTLKNIIRPGIKFGIFGIIGGMWGASLASILPTDILEFIFGIVLIFIAIYNFFTLNSDNVESRLDLSLFNYIWIGLVIGVMSGLLGIGGGLFIILALTGLLGYSMIEAIGISSVFISLTAIGGVFSYVISGWGVNPVPYSVGYISIVNFVFIVIFSMPLAYCGAKIAHRLPQKRLKQVFSIIVLYIGLRMLGILP